MVHLHTDYGVIPSDGVKVDSIVYCRDTTDGEYEVGLDTDIDDECTWIFSAGCPNDPLYKDFSQDLAGIFKDAAGNDPVEILDFEYSDKDENGLYFAGLSDGYTFDDATPKGVMHYVLNLQHGERGVHVMTEIDKCTYLTIKPLNTWHKFTLKTRSDVGYLYSSSK